MIQGPDICKGIKPGRGHVKRPPSGQKTEALLERIPETEGLVCRGNLTGTWGRKEWLTVTDGDLHDIRSLCSRTVLLYLFIYKWWPDVPNIPGGEAGLLPLSVGITGQVLKKGGGMWSHWGTNGASCFIPQNTPTFCSATHLTHTSSWLTQRCNI